jgi:uncharacterized protein YbcI
MPKTKGELEAAAASAYVKFQREQQGRGPTDVRAHLLGDLLLIRSTGIFTPTETHLSASDEGRRLIKSARIELRAIAHAELEADLADLFDAPVVRSYYDIDVEAGEQIEVYIFSENVEKRLPART